MGQNKQVAKNLIFNTISFGINFVISFLFTPYLIRTVGKEAYSFFPLVNNIIGYSSILTAAVGSMGGRFITMSIYQNDKEGANQYFNSVWVANIFLSILFSIVSVFAVIFISDFLTVPEYLETDVQWLFAFGAMSMILGLITGLFGIGTYVKNRLDLSASRKVLVNVIRVLCILLLFYIFKPTIVFMSLSAFIAAVVGVYFNLSFKRRLLPELSINPKKYFSWNKIKETTFSGMWNSINQLSNILLQQVDLLITNIFIGASATGDYAIAKMAPTFIWSLLSVLSGSFMPHLNILFAKKQMSELVKDVSRSIGIVSLFIGVPMGFLIVFGDKFFDLWVPGQDSQMLYRLSSLTIAPLILGAVVNPIYGLFGVVNKLKTSSIAVLIGGTLQTVVILIVVKTTSLGIWSIPIVSGIQTILRNTFFTTIYGGICLGRSWTTFFPALFRGVFAMLVVVGVGFTLSFFIEITNFIDLIAVFLLVGFVSSTVNINIVLDKDDRIKLFNMLKSKIVG